MKQNEKKWKELYGGAVPTLVQRWSWNVQANVGPGVRWWSGMNRWMNRKWTIMKKDWINDEPVMKRSWTIDELADERLMKGWHEGVVRGWIGDEQMVNKWWNWSVWVRGRCALEYICTFMCPDVCLGVGRCALWYNCAFMCPYVCLGAPWWVFVPLCVGGCALVLWDVFGCALVLWYVGAGALGNMCALVVRGWCENFPYP